MKVKDFIHENDHEKLTVIRYNKCLSLVPQSKLSFMESFKHWQPHVVMDKISELPSPPRKKLKIEDNEVFITPKSADKHEVQEISKQDESFSENEWLQLEVVHSEVIDDDKRAWDCRNCDPSLRFYDEEDFINHLQWVHINYEEEIIEENETEMLEDDYENTEVIEEQLETSDSTQPHEEINATQLRCRHCPFESQDNRVFKSHQLAHLDKNFHLSRFEKLFCADCCYQFTTQAHFQSHLNGHQIYRVVSKYSEFSLCIECNIMFCDDKFLSQHQDSHSHDKDFVPMMIPSEGSFLKLGHHRPDFEKACDVPPSDSIKCGHCFKMFADKESCNLHQLIFHVNTLRCPIENRVFKGNQAFSIHMKNNHPELFPDEDNFKCSVCKKKFTNLYDKLKHMKSCDKKKFLCPHCDKRFSQKCYLNTHLRQVSGETSISCEVCGKICLSKHDYQIHFRLFPLRKELISLMINHFECFRSHSNVKPFKCSVCPKAYKTSSARAAHLETHSSKGFNCSICSTRFTSRRTLQKHCRTKHDAAKQFQEILPDVD